ncbi:glycoside hydrolase family 27 protein [Sediminitomix flava]|uniref:Alpha-galactosidase n=1 Tax=Sediminitomix flava TaxID=379075 RepID=A0A315Z5X1_SEDFL|nr:glycoside hydrolase family 27 protein [Sediminitomix flava]PWJ37976.1 alpha galactosidase A [Sediminitomix flava]
MKLLKASSVFLMLGMSLWSCTPKNNGEKTALADVQSVSNEKNSLIKEVAATPPMGWNSFDAYDCRINEKEYLETVDFMAENLLDAGWEYAVIDYVWFNHEPGNWNNPKRRFGHPDVRLDKDGVPIDKLVMDEYGRLLPSEERFPSAKNGVGFKKLAEYVHSKGMKFGIHIMRGIPREAYYNELPIKGTKYTAKDIGEPWDTCPWQNNMFGVDPTKPGAQEYYNSIFELYAEWGVDFIKADDMMVPPYHKGEIEMMRKAIDNSGRPMVLSLSCGEAPLSRANHLAENANMWRISADFWDKWSSLEHNFELLEEWSSHIQPHHWPDGDMLPIGHLSMNGRPHGPDRMSQFTKPEHYTLLTLWSIVRSPLMMGGDLMTTEQWVIDMLKNKDVYYINQHSTDNRQVYRKENAACWIAKDEKSEDRFVALFNLKDKTSKVNFDAEYEYMRELYNVTDIWTGESVGQVEGTLEVTIPAHGARLFRFSEVSKDLANK